MRFAFFQSSSWAAIPLLIGLILPAPADAKPWEKVARDGAITSYTGLSLIGLSAISAAVGGGLMADNYDGPWYLKHRYDDLYP
jgi:hypothetical protein